LLATLDVNVIFRGHPITNRLLKDVKFPSRVILPPPDIQTNELLGIADILISDYSSVFFDFIPTERPIIHYLYDLEEYTKDRGLNLTEEELPGKVVKTNTELVSNVAKKLEHYKPTSKYLAAKNRFCPYDDGKSTEKVVRWFFYGDDRDIKYVNQKKKEKSYLFLGGKLSDKSNIDNLVSELNELKRNKCTVSIMLDRELEKDKDKLKSLQNLNYEINLLAHGGKMPMTSEEAAAIKYYQSNGIFADQRMEQAYRDAFSREVRRLFGESLFNHVFNYETDSNYWISLLESFSIKQ